MIPYLSIIVPAYNEELRLPRTLDHLYRWCSQYISAYEIIVVDNGSVDATPEICNRYGNTFNHFKYIRIERRGKGAAVRCGMLEAVGRWRLMCDADLSMPTSEISLLLPTLGDPSYDICIASREASGADVDTSFHRWAIGRLFHIITRVVLGIPFRDTQCGFKVFSDQAAQLIFKQAVIDGLAFDVEVLYLALQSGLRVVEQPVKWTNDPSSRVRLLLDGWQMLRDVFEIRRLHPPNQSSMTENSPA